MTVRDRELLGEYFAATELSFSPIASHDSRRNECDTSDSRARREKSARQKQVST